MANANAHNGLTNTELHQIAAILKKVTSGPDHAIVNDICRAIISPPEDDESRWTETVRLLPTLSHPTLMYLREELYEKLSDKDGMALMTKLTRIADF